MIHCSERMPYDIDEDVVKLLGRKKKKKPTKKFIAFDTPTIDWQKLSSIITTLSVLFLVAAFLLSTFFLYSDSPTVKKIEGYTGDMARMTRTVTNLTDFVTKSMPSINMTTAMQSAWPQTDEEMSNVTLRGKRVVSDLASLIGDFTETKVIKTIAELSNSITAILLRPNFGKVLDSLEVGVPMIFDTLKEHSTKAFLHVLQTTLNKVGLLLTEERVDKVINALDDSDVKELVSHASSLIQESTKTMKSFNIILGKVAFIVDREEEYIRPVVQTVQHVHKFVSDRVNDEMVDQFLHNIQSVDWNRITRDMQIFYAKLETMIESKPGDVSLVQIGKNLTIEITALVKQLQVSGLIDSSAETIKKLESALSKEEIHEGYVEVVSSMKKVNEMLHDLGEHHMLADFVSLVERFERLEKIVETIFTPLERGMDLYNEEQERKEGGKKGNIQYTNKLINSIDHSRKDK